MLASWLAGKVLITDHPILWRNSLEHVISRLIISCFTGSRVGGLGLTSSSSSKALSGGFYHMSHRNSHAALYSSILDSWGLFPGLKQQHGSWIKWTEMQKCHLVGSLAGFSWPLGIFTVTACVLETIHIWQELTLSPSGPGRPKSPGMPMKPCRRGKERREDNRKKEGRGGNMGCEYLDTVKAAGGTATPLGSRAGFQGPTVQHG